MSSHVLVAAQLAALFAILAPAGKPLSPNIAGIMVLAFGTGLGVSTLLANRPGNFGVYPELRKGAHLIMIGPYHWIRHPMYTAVLICALGLWLMHVTWLSTIGYLVLAAVLWIKAGREEEILIGAFEQYAQYQRRTYRFIPFVY